MRPQLHRLAAVLCLASAFWPLAAAAQSNPRQRLSQRDYDQFYYGLGIGLNLTGQSYELTRLPAVLPNGDVLNNIRGEGSPGINIGLLGVLKLTHNLDLRFIPTVSLQQRNFDFVFADRTELRKIESTYIEFPLLVKYKSDIYKNMRVYLVTGPKYSLNTISNERVQNDPTLLKIRAQDFSWVVGVGLDLYGTLGVKVSPELSYSFGLWDVYVDRNTDIPGVIRAVRTSSIALTIYFE